MSNYLWKICLNFLHLQKIGQTWLGSLAQGAFLWINKLSNLNRDLIDKYDSYYEFKERRSHLVPYAFSDKSGELFKPTKFGNSGILINGYKPLKILAMQYLAGVHNWKEWNMSGFYYNAR